MSKKKVDLNQKNIKEMIKELESKAFGLKNKKQKATLLKQIETLKIKDNELKKEKITKEIKKQVPTVQKIPIGVDPKTVTCLNWLNRCCLEGDGCRFAHENIKKEEKKDDHFCDTKPRHVCRFLIDAINNNEYNNEWVCPFPKCNNIHKLTDIKGNASSELSLEEYLELSRQSLGDNLTPVTEKSFKEWKKKKLKEEEIHRKKVEALSSGVKGLDLFESKPEIFEDDDQTFDVDYKERCYSEEEDAVENFIC